jgi:hypothetical protein
MQCPSTPARTVSDIGPVPGEVVVAGSVYISYYPSVHDGTMEYGDGPSFAKSVGGPPTDWGGQKVLWRILPSYQGPVLVRGRRVDGPNELRFNGGIDEQAGYASLADAPLLAELRLQTTTTEATSNWSSYVRLRAPGCYGVQVDGLPFSASVIFRAVLAPGSSSTPTA